jgi:predicted transcriptional regulator/rubrerythrin
MVVPGGMPDVSMPSATESLRVLQVLVARELVEGRGLATGRAARLLGVAPSAVSQYLSGKRLRREISLHASDERYRRAAREVTDQLLAVPAAPGSAARALLLAAAGLVHADAPRAPPARSSRTSSAPDPDGARALARWARARVRTEQAAVASCMRLAQKARDELTRAVFRQIASDSLRHAEIVASLSTYLDQGTLGAYASGVTRAEVRELIERERKAESQLDAGLGPKTEGLLALLLESMEADERKHGRMLEELLDSGFRPA